MNQLILILLLLLFLTTLSSHAVVVLYVRKKHRFLHTRLDNLERLTWDAPSLIAITRPRAVLPRPGGWAASVDFLSELLLLIETRRPALIVELGSGLSTVVIALKLAEIGSGRLVSIDHDADYAAVTARFLEANRVREMVDLRIASLRKQPELASEMPWYETAQMDDLEDVDLLVVDGPPMVIDPLIRRPALPFFRPRLSPNGCVLLDDAQREGERAIIEEWQQSFPEFEVQRLPLQKGAALITRRVAA